LIQILSIKRFCRVVAAHVRAKAVRVNRKSVDEIAPMRPPLRPICGKMQQVPAFAALLRANASFEAE
jgi:hypothetical protein